MQVTLQPDHALVLLSSIGIFAVGTILGFRVDGARGKYKIPLPNLYANAGMFIENGKVNEKDLAERGDRFNQYQRGHQHILEGVSSAYAFLFGAGILFPRHAAYAGFAWALGSLIYGVGYSISPKYRLYGEAIYLPATIYWIYLHYLTISQLWA